MKSWILLLACRLYAAMLRAYPSGFRREYSREMILAFKNRARDVLEHGGVWAVLSFMIGIVSDWSWTVARERTDAAAATPCTLALNGVAVSSRGDSDRLTRAVSLMLAILGMCLLIVGWYKWLNLTTPWR